MSILLINRQHELVLRFLVIGLQFVAIRGDKIFRRALRFAVTMFADRSTTATSFLDARSWNWLQLQDFVLCSCSMPVQSCADASRRGTAAEALVRVGRSDRFINMPRSRSPAAAQRCCNFSVEMRPNFTIFIETSIICRACGRFRCKLLSQNRKQSPTPFERRPRRRSIS